MCLIPIIITEKEAEAVDRAFYEGIASIRWLGLVLCLPGAFSWFVWCFFFSYFKGRWAMPLIMAPLCGIAGYLILILFFDCLTVMTKIARKLAIFVITVTATFCFWVRND